MTFHVFLAADSSTICPNNVVVCCLFVGLLKQDQKTYRVSKKKGRSQNIIVFHELLNLGCINFKNLVAIIKRRS